MPANLPPQYYELERQFNKETDIREKLRLAKELLAMMPKHKGTDKLQAEMKAKISRFTEQIESGAKKHGTHHVDPFTHIDKEGAAQIIMIGPPNSGKSSILASCTHAQPLIADYPYTTHEPLAGMTMFETVPLQLIDTPPISDQQFPPFMPNLIRQADIVALIADLCNQSGPANLELICSMLKEKNINLTPGKLPSDSDHRFVYKKTVIAANKSDEPGSDTALSKLKQQFPGFTIVPTSVYDDESLHEFRKAIFIALDVIRVYTKRIGHEPEYRDPIILSPGSTVADAALVLHKDFAYKLQYAKIWGKGKFEGQRVKNNYILTDEDIIEFHI
jgi:ribosome-interacting GTPase 1